MMLTRFCGCRRSETIREKRQRGAQLPTEILEVIFSRLSSRDNIRASAVCKEWLAVGVSVRMANKPPWLMFFPKYGDLYEFYDPCRRKTYWLELPKLYGCRICCSKDGWLLLHEPGTQFMFFCCPYTRKYIDLPELQLMNQDQIVTFSAAPTSPSCILFTVKHVSPNVVTVSTCRPGKTQWTSVDYLNSLPFVSRVSNNKLVYCQGLFYCLSLTGWLGVYDPQKSTWAVHSVPPPENFIVENSWKGEFVAEHNGDIFVVCTCAAINPVIYKLDHKDKVWVEMQTLGRMALFANTLSSHARTDLVGTMTNSVYFSKVRFYGKRCVSYSLTNGRYYPRNQRYDWGEQDTFESVWIEPPQDLSTFL